MVHFDTGSSRKKITFMCIKLSQMLQTTENCFHNLPLIYCKVCHQYKFQKFNHLFIVNLNFSLTYHVLRLRDETFETWTFVKKYPWFTFSVTNLQIICCDALYKPLLQRSFYGVVLGSLWKAKKLWRLVRCIYRRIAYFL